MLLSQGYAPFHPAYQYEGCYAPSQPCGPPALLPPPHYPWARHWSNVRSSGYGSIVVLVHDPLTWHAHVSQCMQTCCKLHYKHLLPATLRKGRMQNPGGTSDGEVVVVEIATKANALEP